MFGRVRRFSDEQCGIRDATRDFVRKEIAPFAAEWDRTATVPLETVRRAGALGLFGVCVPTEWGGGGADFTSYVLATEELAYGDAGVCNMISATNAFGWKVRDHGTPQQKARYLRPVAGGEELACLLFTEPQAGSDLANLRTRAVRRGERWVINGTKTFITSGRSASVAVLLAVTDPAAGKRGISAFLTRTDRPGYRVVRVEDKLGHRTNDTCQIALEDLEVPAEDMLGTPGQGLKIALAYLDTGRIGVAAQSVGVARTALDAALAYARERYVISVDDQRRISRDGSILIENGRISRVGRADELAAAGADRVIDARHFVVTPGFVNGHMHISYAHPVRGIFPDDLGSPLKQVFALQMAMTEEEEYHTTLLALLELVRNGTVCLLDPGSTKFPDACLQAYEDAGVRVIMGEAVTDREAPFTLPRYATAEAVARTAAFIDRWDGRR